MRIGIDMDDVLVKYMPGVLQYHNNKYGTKTTMSEIVEYNLWDFWGCGPNESRKRVNDYYYTQEFKNLLPIRGAIEAITELKKQGHEIEIISSRPESVKCMTKAWVNKYLPGMVNKIHHVNTFSKEGVRRSKAEVCKEREIAIHIDDHLHHANKCAIDGIKVLLFDMGYNWNHTPHPHPNIQRVHSWRDILRLIKHLNNN